MRRLYVLIYLFLALQACSLYKNESIGPSESFFRIYNANTSTLLLAHDLVQLEDGGYLVLGSALNQTITTSTVWHPYLMKLDEQGLLLWDTLLAEQVADLSANGAGELLSVQQSLWKIGNDYHFPCITEDEGEFVYALYRINLASGAVENVYQQSATNALRLSLGQVNGHTDGILACTYNPIKKTYTLARHDAGMAKIWETEFKAGRFGPPIGSEVPVQIGSCTIDGEEVVYVRALASTEEELDDQGKFILHLFTASDGKERSKALQAINQVWSGTTYQYPYLSPPNNHDDDEETSLDLPVKVWNTTKSRLSVATLSFGTDDAEVLLPDLDINLDSSGIVNRGRSGFTSHEYKSSLSFYIEDLANDDGKIQLVYVGTTWEGKILLTAFSPGEVRVLGKKYLGQASYYEARGFTNTADGGYAVLGITLTKGRYQQICLFKVSKWQREIDFN